MIAPNLRMPKGGFLACQCLGKISPKPRNRCAHFAQIGAHFTHLDKKKPENGVFSGSGTISGLSPLRPVDDAYEFSFTTGLTAISPSCYLEMLLRERFSVP